MRISTDSDDLTTKFAIAANDCTAGIWLSEAVVETAGIQLNSPSLGNDGAQDLIKNILVTFISIVFILIRAIAYNIINMSIYIHLRKCMQIFENGFKIFPVTCRFFAPFKIFLIIRVISMDNVRRSDHKIKRHCCQKLVKVVVQMWLQAKFNTEMNL